MGVLGDKAKRIRELTALVQKRFQIKDGAVELFAEKVANRGLCAIAQCESLRYKLEGGLAVRRAAYGVLRFIVESGAKGCEVVISGKLRGQRAKAMKFTDGLMIHTGHPVTEYVDTAVRHVMLRQGVIGLKVKIMLPTTPLERLDPRPHTPISSRSESQRRKSSPSMSQSPPPQLSKLQHKGAPFFKLTCNSNKSIRES